MQTKSFLGLFMCIMLGLSLVQADANLDNAMKDFMDVIEKIGTGLCSSRKWEGLFSNSKECSDTIKVTLSEQSLMHRHPP